MEHAEDPAHRMRVSDADREHVAEILRTAAGDGRIDTDELDERLGAAYRAKTVGDLVPLTSDLTVTPPVPDAASVRRASPITPTGEPTRESGVAIMSGYERRGDWLVPARLTVTAVMGGANIDTRRARFSAPEVVISVIAIMGGAEIVVSPTTRVVVEGVGIMGGFAGPRDDGETGPDSPTVRIRGFAFWGGVNVTRKP